jgi:drug/metabolite transporter (DMT)-like permease
MQRSNASPFVWGILICLAGAICFSTKAVLVKLAYRDTQIDAVPLLALRMLFSLPFFVASAWASSAKAGNVTFTGKQWVYVAVIGCLGYYISSLLDFLGLQYVTAAIERLILFIYPTLVLLMNALIFRSIIKPVQWLAVGITYIGLLLAFVSEIRVDSDSSDFWWGAFLIFLCSCTYAMYIVGSGRLIPSIGATKFNSYAMSFACAGVLLHFWIKDGSSLISFSSDVYVYSVTMAVLSTVIPSYLVSQGIKRIGSDNAAIVGSIGPVSTILLAYFFLDENISVLQILGTALVLAGVLVIGWGKK